MKAWPDDNDEETPRGLGTYDAQQYSYRPDTPIKIACKTGTAAALRQMRFPPIRYIVPEVLAEGCTILAGLPKLGKSWMMLDIGLAVAAGGVCLGGRQCEQGDVLYLGLEDNERRLQRRIDKILGGFGANWPAAFHYACAWPRANDGGLDGIRDWLVQARAPRLVVVDVLAAFRPTRGSRETLYESDFHAVHGLQLLASEFRIAIVVVHHLRKSAGDHDPFEKVSGTLGLSGAADTVLILDRDGAGTTLYGRGRDVEELEKAVSFERDTCRWRLLGDADDVRRTDERAAVLEVLGEADEPLQVNEILEATGFSSRGALDVLLSRMTRDGEIERAKRGFYRRAGSKAL